MSTHTLSADTLVSSLTLADGDTIELSGYNIIWDADTRATGVNITNGGTAARFECRNGGGVKLNASLPSNVSPWVDPANPLPESNYAAGLTANASFEFQLNGNFGLGGGAASLPTATRAGHPWAMVLSVSGNTAFLDKDMNLHAGDYVFFPLGGGNGYRVVESWDGATKTATFTSAPPSAAVGGGCTIFAGGILVFFMYTEGSSNDPVVILSANVEFGTLCVLQNNRLGGFSRIIAASADLTGERLICQTIVTGSGDQDYGTVLALDSNIAVEFLATPTFFSYWFYGQWSPNARTYLLFKDNTVFLSAGGAFVNYGEVSGNSSSATKLPLKLEIGKRAGGYIGSIYWPRSYEFEFANCVFGSALPAPTADNTFIRLDNCIFSGASVDNYTEKAGTVTMASSDIVPFAWFHSPATSADVTWRYEDRTVKPHSTIRIRALWKRGENSSATARAAITDTANWYAGTQGGALAETVFPASANDGWQSARLEWHNTSDTTVQVRVWECVTGDVKGGYLRTMEATGGPM